MAEIYSFDVTSECDLQEVDNAVNQARKEVGTRYDFRGLKLDIDLQKEKNILVLTAPDDFKLDALFDVLQTKMVKRGVPLKNLHREKVQTASGGTVRQDITLQQGIPGEKAKEIVKYIKDKKLKKVQASIQKDQVRVTAPAKDDLQMVMAELKKEDFGLELQFGNYR